MRTTLIKKTFTDGTGKSSLINLTGSVDTTLPIHAINLANNMTALNHGLLALQRLHKEEVTRTEAVQAIVAGLNLNNFVKYNSVYTDAVRAATMVLKGLCNKGLIARINCSIRKSNRSRVTTKGYIITLSGREKIRLAIPISQKLEILNKMGNLATVKTLIQRLEKLKKDSQDSETLIKEGEQRINELNAQIKDIDIQKSQATKN
jgi:hypothetical protein